MAVRSSAWLGLFIVWDRARFPQMVPLAKIVYQSRSCPGNSEDNCERFESVSERERRARESKRIEREEDSQYHRECEHDMHGEP